MDGASLGEGRCLPVRGNAVAAFGDGIGIERFERQRLNDLGVPTTCPLPFRMSGMRPRRRLGDSLAGTVTSLAFGWNDLVFIQPNASAKERVASSCSSLS
jgi:hypothetical protein